MKKILLILAVAMVFMITGLCEAQIQWISANQKVVGWDAVTTLIDGTPIPAGDTIIYQIYIVPESDPTKASAVNVGQTTNTQFTVTFTVEGRYFVGVKSERMQGGTKISESIISWSDDPAVVFNGQTWGIQYIISPAGAKGLRPL